MKKLFLVAGLALSLAAPAASAGPRSACLTPPLCDGPDPERCVVPTFIDLVGCKDGVVDPYGAFTVTVIDAGGFPIPDCEVEIVFAPDLKTYSACPGATVDCGEHSVSAISDMNGVATFDLAGATVNSNGVAMGSSANGATISAWGMSLGLATVTVFDENGAVGRPGVEAGDLGAWLGDFGKWGIVGYKGRSDFNHNDIIDAGDLAVWLKVFGRGRSSGGCGTLCP